MGWLQRVQHLGRETGDSDEAKGAEGGPHATHTGTLRPQKGWPDSPVAVKREAAGWESSWLVGRTP